VHPLRGVIRSGIGACLLVAPLALAAGCGSSKKSTTQSTSASVPTGATAATGASGTTQTNPTTTGKHATSTPAPSSGNGGTTGPPLAPGHHAATTTPQPTLAIPKSKEEQIRKELRRLREHPPPPPPPKPTLARVPHAKRFPEELQVRFMTQCKAAAGESTGKCECLIAKFEEAAAPKEQSIAEFVFFEATRHRKGFTQPKRIRQRVAVCARA
jgi:hypothetical protein